jgi:hypothetical protein
VSKRAGILWPVFTVLTVGSLICAGYFVLVYSLTPMLVHDTLHGIQPLTDQQRESLYPALLKAYRPVLFGCSLALVGWIAFAAMLVRSLSRQEVSTV